MIFLFYTYYLSPFILVPLWLYLEFSNKRKIARVGVGIAAIVMSSLNYNAHRIKYVYSKVAICRWQLEEISEAIDNNDFNKAKAMLPQIEQVSEAIDNNDFDKAKAILLQLKR